MKKEILNASPGTKHLLLGNEAIARGVIEAGIGFISCYPGTPSSEVPDTLYSLSREGGYYFEYSVNEKVALEVAGGASLAGVPSLVTMKHVGLNVAADPLMTLVYIGTPGGMVVLSADDPYCHSSQNEQDNRYYARLGNIPCFEPASPQEAKDMVKEAFKLSKKWEHPFLMRTTTRLNHMRGVVEFGTKKPMKSKGDFIKNPTRFVPVPAVARKRHPVVLKNLEEMKDYSEKCPWNKVYGDGELAIIVSGISRSYVIDVIEEFDLKKKLIIMELGFTYPLPENKISTVLRKVKKVLVVEELEPVLEQEIRAIAQKNKIDVEISGKNVLPRTGEYSTTILSKIIMEIFFNKSLSKKGCQKEKNLPLRPPNLCAGCPHRAVYYVVKKVFGDDAIYPSDIGCYTLGLLPPLKTADFLFCMGSSVSGGSGISKVTNKHVVSFIGDSTFFHSGITGLVNAVYNKHNILLVILDNHTTAMTGHQPHPGSIQTPFGPNDSKIDIEKIVKGCGVKYVEKVKAYNLKSIEEALNKLKEVKGTRVLIAEQPCILYARRFLNKKQRTIAYVDRQTEEVKKCVQEFACPAFYLKEDKIYIDESLCTGCMVCTQITKDIKSKKRD